MALSTESHSTTTGQQSQPQKMQSFAPKPVSKKEQRALQPPMPPSVVPKAKKIQGNRRSSKPIINWLQRKLAGKAKPKLAENVSQQGVDGRLRERGKQTPSRTGQRVASSPVPPGGARQNGKLDVTPVKRKTISLNGDDDSRRYLPQTDDEDTGSLDGSSAWSPHSILEADDDASLRPIPPSIPPSPSPSRSSSSYLSDPRTFRSMAASTKPTTLLSIDLNGGGMAHIAQAPTTPSPINRLPHMRTASNATGPSLATGTSITFSALPPSPQSSRPSSLQAGGQSSAPQNGQITSVQAPLHTTHHPRNNPRPSSPPLDNASMLTLASSAYAIPGLRQVAIGASAPPSALGGGDSISQFGSLPYVDAESTSQFVLGDDERLDERDVDASVRALRPRSSRRGSWESEASRWSARVHQSPGTPSLARDRSLWTTNSIRTGALSGDNVDMDERSDDSGDEDGDKHTSPADDNELSHKPSLSALDKATPISSRRPTQEDYPADATTNDTEEGVQETPKEMVIPSVVFTQHTPERSNVTLDLFSDKAGEATPATPSREPKLTQSQSEIERASPKLPAP
ncbi:hypothetical protein HGRIS_009651 [Hohenbuehelia grisea]|uniref:Uncharacterized protein n=1 Tax=Hohenbuehelia grisea TaxID=104357 RepID=A0ABR3J2B4_9AGAR